MRGARGKPTAVTPHGGICGGESQQWLSYPTKPHVRFCAGGEQKCPSLPRPAKEIGDLNLDFLPGDLDFLHRAHAAAGSTVFGNAISTRSFKNPPGAAPIEVSFRPGGAGRAAAAGDVR